MLTAGVAGSKKYQAYGATRGADTLPSEWQFTGQESDGTGLVYLHARYYDPASGQFLSPDTVVPDPSDVFAYNRFMYSRANPLRYNDPSGHQSCTAGDSACWEAQWQWNNCWYNAHGYFWGGSHWTVTSDPSFADEGILDDTVAEAGISWATVPGDGATWTFARKAPIASGIVRLANAVSGGFARLSDLLGGRASMVIASGGNLLCNFGQVPCSMPTWRPRPIVWPAEYIDGQLSSGNHLPAAAVHELAHVIGWQSGGGFSRWWKRNVPEEIALSTYGYNCAGNPCIKRWERWAEAVQATVYGQSSLTTQRQVDPVDVALQSDYVSGLLGGWIQP